MTVGKGRQFGFGEAIKCGESSRLLPIRKWIRQSDRCGASKAGYRFDTIHNAIGVDSGIWTVAINLPGEYGGLRITPNVYTTLEEIDTFTEVMEKIARAGKIPA